MKNLGDMMKQVQSIQKKMETMEEDLAAMTIESQSGGGMVSILSNGKGEVKSVRIDPSLFNPDEKEILEDLLVAAMRDHQHKVKEASQSLTSKLTAGLPLPPGFKLPF